MERSPGLVCVETVLEPHCGRCGEKPAIGERFSKPPQHPSVFTASTLRRGELADMSGTKRNWRESNAVFDTRKVPRRGSDMQDLQSGSFEPQPQHQPQQLHTEDSEATVRQRQRDGHDQRILDEDHRALQASIPLLSGTNVGQIAATPHISRKVKACAACRKQKVGI